MQSMDIDARLVAAEPGNTGYQRDLSVSYDRLGDKAVAQGQNELARELCESAADRLRALHGLEPQRRDLAEELGTALNFLGRVADGREMTKLRAEARLGLAEFQAAGVLQQRAGRHGMG